MRKIWSLINLYFKGAVRAKFLKICERRRKGSSAQRTAVNFNTRHNI